MIHFTPPYRHPSLNPRWPQLVQLIGRYTGKLPEGQWVATEKIDGWRGAWFKGHDGTQRLWTRNGIPIEGIGHIAHRLQPMERVAGEPMMFDGEFQVGGTLAATKAWCQTGWKSSGEAGTLHLFDCQTQAEWERGGSDRPWLERQQELKRLFDATAPLPGQWEWREGTKGKEPDGPHVTLLPWEYVNGPADVAEAAYHVWMRGGEGLVINKTDAPYRRDRTNDKLKVKRHGER
jgi:ATP-dependent DNA ligase